MAGFEVITEAQSDRFAESLSVIHFFDRHFLYAPQLQVRNLINDRLPKFLK